MVKYGLQWILCVNTRIRRRAYSRRRRKAASRPVSRVLYGGETARQPFIWDHRCRRPRATNPDGSVETRLRAKPCAIPIRSCSRWGLPCHDRYRPRGALLPHPFTLAGDTPAVCFLWHFPWGRPRRALPGTVFPWSPDFPLRVSNAQRPPGQLANHNIVQLPGDVQVSPDANSRRRCGHPQPTREAIPAKIEAMLG